MLKYLRIAVTALCLAACALLVALWVRSYSWLNRLRVGKNAIATESGRLIANDVYNISRTEPELMSSYSRHAIVGDYVDIWNARQGALVSVGVGASLPIWPFVVVAAVLAAVPWIPLKRRFSIRTLLVATALLAVALGTMVYLSG
jgi:hypothetical protein